MSDNGNRVSRRNVLKVAGGAVTATGAAGLGAATSTVEVNVGFSAESGRRAAVEAATEVIREFSFDALTIVVAEEAVSGLRSRPDVRYVEENGTMHALNQSLPWGIDRVDADVVHSNGETGNGADVAIIDTGIDDDHPDLNANVGAGKAYVDCKGSNCNYPWSDDNDHGTHCAGIADAENNTEGVVGVSTEATLHAVKVLDSNGSGSFSDVAAGIEYVANQGWDVGSLSLGASSGSSTVKDACSYAYKNGVLLVAAAGNDGPCSDCVGYPAAYDECIAISSTDSDDSLSSFSSTGPEVELAAPGGDIYSSVIGGYDTFSGTSMATPHVAGAGGQLMSNGYANKEARQQLNDTAEDIGLSSNEQGNGLLDVEAALGGSTDTSVAVSTGSATNVTDSSATLNGELTDLGGASSADVYFEWREAGASSWTTTSTQTLSSTGSFSADVSGLNSGTDYDFRAVAEASDGDSDTGTTATFTTGSSSGGNAPTVENYTVTEAGSPNPHAEITADWSVSDADADLDTVVVDVYDSTGSKVRSSTTDVSGSSASGTDEFKIKHDGGDTYDVTLTVTDAGGNTASETRQVSS